VCISYLKEESKGKQRYFMIQVLDKDRGAQILVAVITLLLVITLLAYILKLTVIGFILKGSTVFIAFAMIVVFQPEIRNALAKLGSSQLLMFNRFERLEFMESFIEAVLELSNKRMGALFAMERRISLKEQRETGVLLDSEFSKELALSIFYPKTVKASCRCWLN